MVALFLAFGFIFYVWQRTYWAKWVKWLVTGILVFSLLTYFGFLGRVFSVLLPSSRSASTTVQYQQTATNKSANPTSSSKSTSTPTPKPSAKPVASATPTPAPSLTLSQRNAIGKAQSYLMFKGFSRKGLIGQLEYEGFDTIDAEFAVDTLDIDWNEQAAKSAQSYLNFTSMSRSRLIQQLEYEGFTTEQAEYGAKSVGY